MKTTLILFGVWIPSALCVVLNFKPEIPSTPDLQALRTATTVTLTKPICVFADGDVVDVFGVQTNAKPIPNEIGSSRVSTYQQTNGGKTGPYRAASFDIPTCTSAPFVVSTVPAQIREAINQYLFRVGNDAQCLSQISNLPENCNAPLNAHAQYRFKYAVRNISTNTFINETLWSDSITLLQAPEPTVIDTWPGKRTGGMVVITTILVILLSLLLCVFVALLIYLLCLKEGSPVVEQQPIPRSYLSHHQNLGFSEGTYADPAKAVSQQPPEPEHYQSIEASLAPVASD
uniref:uroplakin-3a-like isoform X1 n=2 Tax=Pristiophorus japonicus TaxID=55135 RepID=UPI00398F6846